MDKVVELCRASLSAQYANVGGWVGRVCFGIREDRVLLCLQQVRDGWASFLLFFFISSILSSFSYASSVGRLLDSLKYLGLGRYDPAVVVSYYRRRAR